LFHIVLHQPEIPPNTGNIIRLASNMGATLHLIEPLGFVLDDKHLKRAGLDYKLSRPLLRYSSFEDFLLQNRSLRIYLCSTKANTLYSKQQFRANDAFVFGSETKGLPPALLDKFYDSQKIRIPMVENSRSLNLSNAVAIVVYEAWRQLDFKL